MRICKLLHIAAYSVTAVILAAARPVTAAAQPADFPDMPSLSAPDMPSISAPAFGGNFYIPGAAYKNGGMSNSSSAADTEKSSSGQPAEKAVSVSGTSSGKQQEVLAASRLSAADFAELNSSGLFSGIYDMLGRNTGITEMPASSTDMMLREILSRLTELKDKDAAQPAAANAEPASAVYAADLNTASRPAILRFVINGRDILNTLKTVCFSDCESDGTFLLTGDRKYLADNKTRSETFYLLFKATGNNGAQTGYKVQPEVIQDYKNEYSFLYKLAENKELSAAKTGNLVSMRVTGKDLNMDLLLDISRNSK